MSGRGIAWLLAGLLLPGVLSAAENWFEQADMAAQSGDHAAMQRAYEHVLSTDPNNVRALNGKATAQAWRGNYFAAVETYQQALTVEQANIEALTGMGYAFAWAGDYALATKNFDRVLQIAPGNIEARKGKAYVALWSGNAVEAQRQFASLAEQDRSNADYAVALGQAALQSGQARVAVDSFDQALAVDATRSDALTGRRAAYAARPRAEASAWYGSTSNADSGLRQLEFAWWANERTRLAAKYDDSLSLDNPAIARRGESAETYTGQLQYQVNPRFTAVIEAGQRSLPDGDQAIYRAEAIVANLPGRVTLGAQIGSHEAGYDDSLYYLGLGIPLSRRWQVEANTYFSTTGPDQENEWRGVFNVVFSGDNGLDLLLGAGAGEVDRNGVANPDRVAVAHAMLSAPLFGYHRLHLTFRHENLPTDDINIAMLGVTLRLPH